MEAGAPEDRRKWRQHAIRGQLASLQPTLSSTASLEGTTATATQGGAPSRPPPRPPRVPPKPTAIPALPAQQEDSYGEWNQESGDQSWQENYNHEYSTAYGEYNEYHAEGGESWQHAESCDEQPPVNAPSLATSTRSRPPPPARPTLSPRQTAGASAPGNLHQQQQQMIAQQIMMQRLQRQRSADLVSSSTMHSHPPLVATSHEHPQYQYESGESDADAIHMRQGLVRRVTVGEGPGIAWRRSIQPPPDMSMRDEQSDTPPPLPEMPPLLGQQDLTEKLYSSRGISRRMTTTEPLHDGSGNISTIPTLASSESGNAPTLQVSAEEVSVAVGTETTTTTSTESTSVTSAKKTSPREEKEGWLTYLSGWLLYRPSASSLAEKNILKSSELPPGAPSTSGASQSGRIFGISLDEIMEKQSRTHPTLTVPLLIAKALGFLHKNNAAVSEGIFREAGSTMQMNQLRARFENGEPIDFSTEKNVNNVANLAKAYLRELPEPLLTSSLYDHWIYVCELEEEDAALNGIKDTLRQLPAVNKETLRQLVKYWALVLQYEHVNRMNIAALATVVGPTLLFKKGGPAGNIENIHLVNRLTSLLILHHEHLFASEEVEPPIASTPTEIQESVSPQEDEDEVDTREGDWDYPFEGPDDTTNTKFNAEGVFLGGTLQKLVERLTSDKEHDPFFVRSFLLTLHSFSSPAELIDLLTIRYDIPARLRSGRSKDEWELYKMTIRSKIWFVVKTWVESYWSDFEGLDGLQVRLTTFLNDKLAIDPHFTKPAHKLLYMVSRKAAGQELPMVPVGEVPKPIKPPVLLHDLTEVHPTELARQLALVEFSLYLKIQPTECLDLRWSKQQHDAPNVLALIRRFNLLSNAVAIRILREKNLAQRIKVLNFFISVAIECQKMQNYNGMMEVVSALTSAPIHRLKKSLDGLPQRSKAAFEEFTAFTEANYKAYRESVKCAEPPCLPYLGVYLSDLTFIEEGNVNLFASADENEAGAIINFDKRRRVAAVIVDLINFQKKPFPFETLPKVRELIEATLAATEREIANDGGRAATDERLYQLSLDCEPRGSAITSGGGNRGYSSLFSFGSGSSSTPSPASSSGTSIFSSGSLSSTLRGFFSADH